MAQILAIPRRGLTRICRFGFAVIAVLPSGKRKERTRIANAWLLDSMIISLKDQVERVVRALRPADSLR